MDQEEFEIQLKVWKELAVNKQVLIRVATSALGLDPECSSDKLKEALDATIKQARATDVEVNKAREQAKATISAMEKKVAESERARAAAEAARAKTLTALQSFEQRIVEGRTSHAQELKKISAQLAEKQKALKAINIALADTPENVVKKLKRLKKEKFDEATARKRAEADGRSLRKEKQQLEQRITEAQSTLEHSAELVDKYRELQKLCQAQHDQLKPLVEDEESLPALPELDEQLLESIEQAARGEEK